MNKSFDLEWTTNLISKSAKEDSFLQRKPELLDLLLRELPKCKVVQSEATDKILSFRFVNGEDWHFKKSINISSEEADLFIDLMQNESIGSIEIRFR